MEVKFHFPIHDSANPFHQAAWFVVGFSLSLDHFQRGTGKHGERALVDDLISRIQFRNDKVNRRPIREHSVLKRIFVRSKAREGRKQAVVEIDDAAGESPAGAGGQHAHVTGQDDVVDIVLVEQFDHPLVVGFALGIADMMPVDTELLGHTATTIPVADHYGRSRMQPFVAHRPQQSERGLGAVGRTDGQSRQLGVNLMFVAGPGSNGQTFEAADFVHLPAKFGHAVGRRRPIEPEQHREEPLRVMVVHLDFVDVRSGGRHVVDDGIGQTAVVWPDCSDHDLHGVRLHSTKNRTARKSRSTEIQN